MMQTTRKVAVLVAMLTLVSSLARASEAPVEDESRASDTYQRNYIGFGDIFSIGSGIGVGQPYQGKYLRPLTTEEFYQAVGKPDLAESYVRNRRWKRGLAISGSILAAAGGITALTGGLKWGLDSDSDCSSALHPFARGCDTSDDETATWVGVGTLALGTTLLIAAGVIPCPDLTPYQAREMADEHNEALRRKLGLPEDSGYRTERETPKPRIAFLPQVNANGARMEMQLSF